MPSRPLTTALLTIALAGAYGVDPATIPAGAYTVATPEGHLAQGGKRVRYWGMIGYLTHWGMLESIKNAKTPDERSAAVAKAYRDHDLMSQRLVDLGFNLHRLWDATSGPVLSHDYIPGDGSNSDLIAHQLHSLDQKGIKIWMSSINHGWVGPKDVDIIDDPATAAAWTTAMKEWVASNKGEDLYIRGNMARYFDPRWEALGIARLKHNANFPNKYKGGLRWADDPQNVVWELENEEWPFGRFFSGEWQKLPKFFRDQLLNRWLDYLKTKYQNDAGLTKAWGFLMPGESLAERSVQLAPMRGASGAVLVGDPNPETVKKLTGTKQQFSRDEFTRARGADVCEFFVTMIVEHKKRERVAVKSWGRSAAASPLIFDCGIGYEIQSQYLHQQADAVSHCTYIKGMAHDPEHRRFPFISGLEELPRMAWDVPWVEHNKVEGKPYFVYENQLDNRTKYRAEYPLRIAALGAIQEWDIVNWHDYGGGNDSSAKNPWEGELEVGHSLNLHYKNDEVQNSSMRAASEIFKNSAVKAAPSPTLFVYGRKALYDPVSMDYGMSYGKLGEKMMPTTYRHGVRILIDPTLDDRPEDPVFKGDKGLWEELKNQGGIAIGESFRPRIFESNPIRPTPEIEYDWQHGHLIMDAPAAMAYTGFVANEISPHLRFKNGAVIKNITVKNPPDMPYPVTKDELYVAITLASCDGQPLGVTKKAVVSAMSTSFNTGYELDTAKRPLPEFTGAEVKNRGTLPVLVARVGCVIECPAIAGMTYVLRDYAMNELGKGTLDAAGTLSISADAPIFIIELSR